MCHRWVPGARLLPATDDRSETHVVITDPGTGEQRAALPGVVGALPRAGAHAQLRVHRLRVRNGDKPEAVTAIEAADIVFLAPSNPVVSIGAILAVPGIRSGAALHVAPIVGYSPIIGGKPLRGMADECLTVIGVDSTSQAVGRHYGARSGTGMLDGWFIADGDSATVDGVATVRSVPLLMTDPMRLPRWCAPESNWPA